MNEREADADAAVELRIKATARLLASGIFPDPELPGRIVFDLFWEAWTLGFRRGSDERT